MALKAFPFSYVQHNDLAVRQRFVRVMQNGIELDCVARLQVVPLVWKGYRQFARQHPTHFVIIAMYFRSRDLRPLPRGSKQCPDVSVQDLAENEIAADV